MIEPELGPWMARLFKQTGHAGDATAPLVHQFKPGEALNDQRVARTGTRLATCQTLNGLSPRRMTGAADDQPVREDLDADLCARISVIAVGQGVDHRLPEYLGRVGFDLLPFQPLHHQVWRYCAG